VSGLQKVTVTREYRSSPDECTRAMELLLKKSVNKAARPAPEPDSPDNAEGLQNDRTARNKYNA
jgi:hypothetical protein